MKYLENTQDMTTEVEVFLDGDEIKYQVFVSILGKERINNILSEEEIFGLYSVLDTSLKSPMTKRLRESVSRNRFFE